MLSEGEALWYIEYRDHGRVTQNTLNNLESKPLTLWVCGKIFRETKDFIAVVCSGSKERLPSSEPTYEIIQKDLITKKELLYTVD